MVRERLERAKDGGKLLDRENRKRAGECFMETKKNRFINIQLFAEPEGASIPSENGATPPSIDYESEYKKMVAERDSYKAEAEKQKGLKDKYASENADYKKKELDKMSDDEKKAREYEELVNSNNALAEELRAIKLEREFLGEGFTVEEYEGLSKEKFSAKSIASLLKSKVDEAVKSAKAEFIKGSTPDTPMGKGTTNNAQEKTGFQKFQESQESNNNRVEI